jgi:ATP-binding cassette subfamily B protein
LARAFYSNKEIFILDEFTSALDAETEMEILNSLEIYKKTIIMVSHKKSALKKCNKIYQLNNSEFLTS